MPDQTIIETWERDGDEVQITARTPHLIWWLSNRDGGKRLRWSRLSKFYRWRHGAKKVQP